MPENNRFKHSNFTQVFGRLQKVNSIKRGCFEKFVIPAIVFGLFLFGVAAYLGSEDWVTIPICALPFLLLSCGLVWHLFRTRKAELRIYENGFTYEEGKKLQACLWSELKNCHRRERNARELTGLEEGVYPLGAVEKKNGETIEFDRDLEGTPELAERFESRKTAKTKSRRRKPDADLVSKGK
jgi:hypothetical protein